MNRISAHGALACLIPLLCLSAAAARAAGPPAGTTTPPDARSPPPAVTAPAATTPVAPPPVEVPRIAGLFDGSATRPASNAVGLNHKLWVVLEPVPTATPDHYVLFFNGSEVKGLDSAIDVRYPIPDKTPNKAPSQTPNETTSARDGHALVFNLQRNSDNEAFWKDLLGAPKKEAVKVVVSLGQRSDSCTGSETCTETVRASIIGKDGSDTFNFKVFSTQQLVFAFIAIAVVFTLVWGHARTRTTLRDNLLPQLPASSQPYSLGRWQMAFWFTLVFAAFVFLFVLLWDTNTVTEQALTLMGISGATALASGAIDDYKNSPADDANRGLQALGLNTYADVVRIEQEVADREKQLAALPQVPASADTTVASPVSTRRAQLQVEIKDRNVILRTYRDKIGPFVSQGWFKDITTDLNGTALHRLQVVCWTGALGIVFVIGVYHDLAMPAFSATLLALMGISGAGYVGFKFPEVNS